MTDDACTLPARDGDSEFQLVQRLLDARRIAVVGLSDDPSRPSNEVSRYMLSAGKTIIPVNPMHQSVLGQKCYASLKDVPPPIDLVNVFRRPQFCADVVRDAISVGAAGIWLQSGIRSPEARRLAEEAGIDYVEDRCLMVEHQHRGR